MSSLTGKSSFALLSFVRLKMFPEKRLSILLLMRMKKQNKLVEIEKLQRMKGKEKLRFNFCAFLKVMMVFPNLTQNQENVFYLLGETEQEYGSYLWNGMLKYVINTFIGCGMNTHHI